MNKKKKEYIDISIAKLIWKISRRDLVLPSLQRKYVWSHQQICQLFDSIMQDYPIGTFMFWKIGNRSTNDKMLRKKLMFYEFLRDYNKNEDLGSGIEFKPAISVKGPITNVIDGQQRITSLLIGLTGSYFRNRAESKLYINLNMRKNLQRKKSLNMNSNSYLIISLIDIIKNCKKFLQIQIFGFQYINVEKYQNFIQMIKGILKNMTNLFLNAKSFY